MTEQMTTGTGGIDKLNNHPDVGTSCTVYLRYTAQCSMYRESPSHLDIESLITESPKDRRTEGPIYFVYYSFRKRGLSCRCRVPRDVLIKALSNLVNRSIGDGASKVPKLR